MPKNYKTYASPKSFSEFQLRAPDQTAKIEQQTQRQLRGAERAQRFREENQEIYLRAQRLVNSAEDANRETNYRMQSLERQSYKDALTRDYQIELNNLENENKAAQTNLQNISQFSQTAMTLVGQFMEAEEEKKVAAAHDVISRTGVTYDQMLAFQKMNDNLTRSEFAAQDSVQEMFGPDADSTLIDGMFAVYQNRNTKRWVEHKQLFRNTLNKLPAYIDAKISEEVQKTGQMPTDFERILSEARREFIEQNFAGKARPEVLSGAGVYAKMDELINNRRNVFLKERRELQKKELKQDRQNSFHDAYAEDGIAGMIRANSTNPSFQKRQDWLAALKDMSKMSGAFGIDEDDIDSILSFKGGGSNGQTIEESFPGFAADLEDLKDEIIKRKNGDADRAEKAVQREVEEFATDRVNDFGADGEFTDAEAAIVENEILAQYGGRESKVLQRVRRTTSDAQRIQQTQTQNDYMYSKGLLTEEFVLTGKYESPAKTEYYLNLARSQQKYFADPTTSLHLSQIENTIKNSAELTASRSAYGELHDLNHTLFINQQKQNYRKYVLQFSAVENTSLDKAREMAKQRVDMDIKEALKPENFDGKSFKEFLIAAPNEQQQKQLSELQTTGQAQLKKIADTLYENRKNPEKAYTQVAMLINHAEIERAVKSFGDRQSSIPPIIRYIGEKTNQNALQVLQRIAPFIPDKNLKLQMDSLTEAQNKNYRNFKVTPFSYIRNTYRTAERTGRANVGDTKTGASAPIRPSMFKVVQYVSGDPAIKGINDGRIVYDNGDGPRGHGGDNYHNHYEFATQEQAAAAKALFERNGYRVTSYLRPNDTGSAHSRGVAIDVAPPLDLPRTEEAEAAWSAGANALIQFNPLENE